MDNPGMLRGTGLREKRQSVDTGTGVQRTAGNQQREAMMQGRGNFINFYDDLGVSTTQPQANLMRKEETEFQGKVDEQKKVLSSARQQYNESMGTIGTAEGQLAEAYASLPGLGEAVQDSWSSYRNQLTPVRVVGGSDGSVVEATYYLPRDAAESLIAQRGIFASWHEPYFNVMGKNNRNQEIHDVLRTSANTLEYSYKEKAAGELAQALGASSEQLAGISSSLAASKGQVENYGAQVSTAESTLQATLAERQKQWDDLHNKYNAKIENADSILSGIKVGE